MKHQARVCGNSSSRTHVALLVETSLASGRDILRGITRYVHEHTQWSLYHEAHGLTDAVPAWLSTWRGDGIIARIQTQSMANAIAATGIPTVDVLGMIPHLAVPLVHVDNTAVARMAAEHLMERGVRRFAFYGIQGENWSAQRWLGLAAAASPVEVLKYEQPRDATDRRSWERVENRLARWLSSLPKPVGILVCSDQCGPQVLEACRRAGVDVPDRAAVIGVDNDETLCEVCYPALSSVDAGHVSVGYEAARVLDGLLRGGRPPAHPVLIAPQGVVARQSTDVLAVDDPALAVALKLIRERAHLGLNVDMLAREVGVSRSVLQRRFRARLNRPIHQAILAARVREAQNLLTKTTLPLATIAARAGFRHQEYMGAVFKARFGTTPAEVRSAARKAARR
ncbi:MAG: XylR family transcriptional regulator [Steroidobacteraceae bacterium]